MSSRTIENLLKGTYFPEKDLHISVKSIRIESSLTNHIKDLISECGLQGRPLVVSDVNTYGAVGAEVIASIGADNSIIFEHGVKPDISNVSKIQDVASNADYIIAVGSGTINDLCKYASFLLGTPYVIFGTAPSMNGYSSANASIIMHGHKKTLKAHLPQGIFLDMDILSKAPLRLIRSGLGDSLCRPTAQADWLLSHLLLDTFYTDTPFELLKGIEWDLFNNSSALVKRDVDAIRLLCETLILSGFGMYIAGGSYPASQGEHMIAHTMEMMYGENLPHSYHGEQIGITTLTIAKLQEEICNQVSGISYQLDNFPETLNLEPETYEECREEYKKKQFGKNKLDFINEKLETGWDDIRGRLTKIMLPQESLYKILKDAGCPLKPEDIGWKQSQYDDAFKFAKFTRGRFTFLDL